MPDVTMHNSSHENCLGSPFSENGKMEEKEGAQKILWKRREEGAEKVQYLSPFHELIFSAIIPRLGMIPGTVKGIAFLSFGKVSSSLLLLPSIFTL